MSIMRKILSQLPAVALPLLLGLTLGAGCGVAPKAGDTGAPGDEPGPTTPDGWYTLDTEFDGERLSQRLPGEVLQLGIEQFAEDNEMDVQTFFQRGGTAQVEGEPVTVTRVGDGMHVSRPDLGLEATARLLPGGTGFTLDVEFSRTKQRMNARALLKPADPNVAAYVALQTLSFSVTRTTADWAPGTGRAGGGQRETTGVSVPPIEPFIADTVPEAKSVCMASGECEKLVLEVIRVGCGEGNLRSYTTRSICDVKDWVYLEVKREVEVKLTWVQKYILRAEGKLFYTEKVPVYPKVSLSCDNVIICKDGKQL